MGCAKISTQERGRSIFGNGPQPVGDLSRLSRVEEWIGFVGDHAGDGDRFFGAPSAAGTWSWMPDKHGSPFGGVDGGGGIHRHDFHPQGGDFR
jgi:hypothetical protein